MVPLPALLAALTAGRLVALPDLVGEMRTPDGPKLAIAPELRNEAIYLRGDLGPPARLRTLVARAASAEWVMDGATLRLERPNALRRRLAEAEQTALAADFQAALGTPKPVASVDPGRRLDPESRANARLSAALRPEFLAALPPSGIVRYLGVGGNGLLSLPFDAVPILAAYRAESSQGGGARIAGSLSDGGLVARYDAILAASEPGLTAERTPYGLTVVRLYAVARSGEAALVATAEIETDGPLKGTTPPWPLVAAGTSPGARLAAVPAPPKATVAATLVRPGAEPLSFGVRPFLDRLLDAGTVNDPVVLDLPDRAMALSAAKPSTLAADARLLRAYVTIEVDGAVTIGRPRLPLEATAERFPRSELLAWSRLVSGPAQELDAAADLADRVGPFALATGLERVLAASAGFAVSPESPYAFSPDGREGLRLWGALPASARAALDAGRSVGLGEFNAAAQKAAGTILVRTGERMGSGPIFLDRDGSPQAALSWALQPIPSALVVEKTGREFVYDATALGSLLGEQEKGHLLDPAFGYPDLRRSLFRPAYHLKRAYGFVYAARPALPVTGALRETRLGDAAPAEVSALPPEILAPLNRSLDAARKGG